MDIIDHLTADHRKAEDLIDRLGDSEPGPDRIRLIDQLEEDLAVHMAVEEDFLYPIVVDRIGAEDATEANNEHDLARDALATLRQAATEPGFGAAVEMIKGGIGHHVDEEENDMFPRLRAVAPDELASMDPERLEAVAGATKAELYQRARAEGLEGRSTMTRPELTEALGQSNP